MSELENSRIIKTLPELGTFARDFLKQFPQGAAVGLVGDLGAGKTTFVRTCVQAICEQTNRNLPRVVSPSFVIHQSYGDLTPPVEHFDLYRLNAANPETLVELGFYEAYENCRQRSGFVFIEWPERGQPGELKLDLMLAFEFDGEFDNQYEDELEGTLRKVTLVKLPKPK